MLTINLLQFRNILGISESGGNYTITYPKGSPNPTAFGKYQFIKSRITDIALSFGERTPTPGEFLNNAAMQERYFDRHVQLILSFIESNALHTYVGKPVTGKNKYKKTVSINLDGLVAGAHLGGQNGLKQFLQSNFVYDPGDALGTHISDYVAKFSDKKKALTLAKKNSQQA